MYKSDVLWLESLIKIQKLEFHFTKMDNHSCNKHLFQSHICIIYNQTSSRERKNDLLKRNQLIKLNIN